MFRRGSFLRRTQTSVTRDAVVATVVDMLETLQLELKGRYRVCREIGHGGMATVYLAYDVLGHRDVAIKVLNPEFSATVGVERFQREISLVSQLHHPHILGFHESGTAHGLLYYAMPFVKGESLRERLNREGPLPLHDVQRIVLQVADALHAAHAQGIVHRDVKPENILLDESGHALVADFGIASAVTNEVDRRITQTGMAVGTPVYMSPEQSTGESVGAASDIYSLGCVLFEMLTGRPPFSGKNVIAIMAQHALEPAPSVRAIRPAVPLAMEEAINAAMAKSPIDRPASAADFAEIIRRAMPISPKATARWYLTPTPLACILTALVATAALLWTLARP